MIAYLSGNVTIIEENYIVIEVNGIGYKVYCPTSTCRMFEVGKSEKIFTHMYIKEDILNLYGFKTPEDKELFELLITVNGVGPKAGLSMLSTFSSQQIKAAISGKDAKTLAKTNGIGIKTAELIILKLKDKVDFVETAGVDENIHGEAEDIVREAISALKVLGYSPNEAKVAVMKVLKKGSSLEETVKEALRSLM